MSDSRTTGSHAESAAYQQGRGEGLAIAALALSGAAFINLLGAEKALLALLLATLALSGLRHGSGRTKAMAAIGLATVYLVTVVGVLVVYRDKIGPLIALLKDLA